jgi:hypothetical protein
MDEKIDKQMSRGAMTAWIVGTMMTIFLVVGGIYAFQENPRYPGCAALFGTPLNRECLYEHASRRLDGGSYLTSPFIGDSELENPDGLAAAADAAGAAAAAADAASGE